MKPQTSISSLVKVLLEKKRDPFYILGYVEALYERRICRLSPKQQAELSQDIEETIDYINKGVV